MLPLAPLIERIRDDLVYIRISSTLSFTMSARYWGYLCSVASRGEGEILVPLYSVSSVKRGRYVVIPPFRIDVPETVEVAGVYRALVTGEKSSFAGVEMLSASLDPKPLDPEMLCKFTVGEATILVESVQDTLSAFEYVSITGKKVKIIHLMRACYGQRIEGFGVAPVAVVIGCEARQGDFIKARWIMAKHGRGDSHTSGTSHQVDVYIMC